MQEPCMEDGDRNKRNEAPLVVVVVVIIIAEQSERVKFKSRPGGDTLSVQYDRYVQMNWRAINLQFLLYAVFG